MILFCSAQQSRAGVNAWTTSGPEGAKIERLLTDSFLPPTLYAVTGSGITYRSNDQGERWTALASYNRYFYETWLVADPLVPNTLHVESNDGRLAPLVSYDAGDHWEDDAGMPRDPSSLLAFDPSTPSIRYASTAYGVFRSTDAGETWYWKSKDAPQTSASQLIVGAGSPGNVYERFGNYVFRSLNRGETWQQIDADLPKGCGLGGCTESGYCEYQCLDEIIADPVQAGVLWVTTNGGEIFRSIDSGDRFARLDQNEWYGENAGFVIDPIDSQKLYIGKDGEIQFSRDLGKHWTSLTSGLPDQEPITSIVINPHDSSVLYAGGAYAGVLKSTDAGQTWHSASNGMNNTSVRSLVAPSGPTLALYAVVDGPLPRLFRSSDGGHSWQLTALHLPDWPIEGFVVDPLQHATLFAASYAGVFRSTNDGATWQQVESLDTIGNTLVSEPSSPATLYVALTTGGALKTVNGGTNWTDASAGLPIGSSAAIQVLVIDPAQPTTLYAGPRSSGLYRTVNGGSSWIRIDSGELSDVTQLAVDPRRPTRLYAVDQGRLRRSDDAGVAWTDLHPFPGVSNLSISSFVVHPTKPGVVYVAGLRRGRPSLAWSADAGDHWRTLRNSGSPVDPQTLLISPLAPDTLLGATNGFGVVSYEHIPQTDSEECTGDCDADGHVTIDELVALVAIALDLERPTTCEAGDLNGDAMISVDEIIAAVADASAICEHTNASQ